MLTARTVCEWKPPGCPALWLFSSLWGPSVRLRGPLFFPEMTPLLPRVSSLSSGAWGPSLGSAGSRERWRSQAEVLSPSALPPQWQFLVLSRNTAQFAVSAAKEGGGSSEEGRRPPSGRDPSLRKCVLTCIRQGRVCCDRGECSGGELAGVVARAGRVGWRLASI